MKDNILVIGAGNIGLTICHMLPKDRFNIKLVDSDEQKLKQSRIKNFNKSKIDIFHEDILIEELKDKKYVINAGPYFLSQPIADAALLTETNYFDLTEDIKQTEYVKKIAKRAQNSVFVPQCGLAPGFISIVANSLAKEFDEVDEIKMRVGALPMYPSNALKYNMTWSTDGLVNEYLHPCKSIHNGEIVNIKPLRECETFSLDGDKYEAFNTSGGLGTLCETWLGRAKNVNYKTIRYPGHLELMKFLIDDMKLGENNGLELKKLMNKAIPITNQDVVLIFVSVVGYKKGKLIQEVWTKKIYGGEYFGHKWSAIQLTTAAGICGMIRMHSLAMFTNKENKQVGLIKQEDASLSDFMQVINNDFNGIFS